MTDPGSSTVDVEMIPNLIGKTTVGKQIQSKENIFRVNNVRNVDISVQH